MFRLPLPDIVLSCQESFASERSAQPDVYEVKRISDKTITPDNVLYLVHWRDYERPTWEPICNLQRPRVIAEFERSVARADAGPLVAEAIQLDLRPNRNRQVEDSDDDGDVRREGELACD